MTDSLRRRVLARDRMTRDKLLTILRENDAILDGDWEIGHSRCDEALIEYINDPEIAAAFENVGKWYA